MQPPIPLPEPIATKAGPMDALGLAVTGALAGGVVGAATNMVNGAVSPIYFVNIMGWSRDGIWRTTVIHGVFEGLVVGSVFAVIFATVVAVVTKGACSYRQGVRPMLAILAAILVCWVGGGLVAMALAARNPEAYRQAIIGVPRQPDEMLRYAWVGGSITGAEIGGFVCVIAGCLWFRKSWRRHEQRHAARSDNKIHP